MAIAGQAFNKNVDQLLNYFLEKNLMGQRYGQQSALQTQDLAGNMALESARTKNLQGREWQNWIYQISRDPEINSLQSEIFVKKRAGEDTTREEANLKDTIFNVGQAALKAVKGELTEVDMNNLMRLPDATMNSLLGEFGATTRQTQRIERVEEPGLQLEAIGAGQREKEIGLRGQEIGLRGREVAQKDIEQTGKLSDQEKATISLIGDTKKFLIGEGVKPAPVGQLMRDMATGRALDPLSPENRGMALQWLNDLEYKVIKKTPMTPADERFLSTVMNTSGVEPRETTPEELLAGRTPGLGGLVNPETGLRGGEEAKVNSLVEQKVNDRMYTLVYQGFKNRGFSDEAAAFHSRALLAQLK